MGIAIINRIHSYIRVGRLLHIITITECLIALFVVPRLYSTDPLNHLNLFLLKFAGICFLVSLPIFTQLDAWSRYQYYKQLKDQLYIYGYKNRILRPALKSRCQRDAATAAAAELGLNDVCKQFFKSRGYRWYHVLPDFIVNQPQFLLSRCFWITTFFVSFYTPKIDFSVLSSESIRQRFEIQLHHA